MTHSIENYKNRIEILRARDAVANAAIIRKLERKIRQLSA